MFLRVADRTYPITKSLPRQTTTGVADFGSLPIAWPIPDDFPATALELLRNHPEHCSFIVRSSYDIASFVPDFAKAEFDAGEVARVVEQVLPTDKQVVVSRDMKLYIEEKIWAKAKVTVQGHGSAEKRLHKYFQDQFKQVLVPMTPAEVSALSDQAPVYTAKKAGKDTEPDVEVVRTTKLDESGDSLRSISSMVEDFHEMAKESKDVADFKSHVRAYSKQHGKAGLKIAGIFAPPRNLTSNATTRTTWTATMPLGGACTKRRKTSRRFRNSSKRTTKKPSKGTATARRSSPSRSSCIGFIKSALNSLRTFEINDRGVPMRTVEQADEELPLSIEPAVGPLTADALWNRNTERSQEIQAFSNVTMRTLRKPALMRSASWTIARSWTIPSIPQRIW